MDSKELSHRGYVETPKTTSFAPDWEAAISETRTIAMSPDDGSYPTARRPALVDVTLLSRRRTLPHDGQRLIEDAEGVVHFLP